MKSKKVAAAIVASALAVPAAAIAAGNAVVVRDAETGALRAPNAAEAAALRGKPSASLRAAAPAQRKLSHGAVAAEVPESLMQYSVVQVSPDGSLSRSCVQGAEQAALTAERPQFAKPLTMSKPVSTARTARGMIYEDR